MTRVVHNIGHSRSSDPRVASNYTSADDVRECGDHLTFDGVYTSVWHHRNLLKDRQFILFPMGGYMGSNNQFDSGMPLEWYCDRDRIEKLLELGGTLGWHTHNHHDLTRIPLPLARIEMVIPEWAKELGCEDFAYPYGRFNDDLKELAQELGYKRAWSVTQGDGSEFALNRRYL